MRSDSQDPNSPPQAHPGDGRRPAPSPDPRSAEPRKSLDEQLNESGQTEADGQGGSTIGVSDR
jgi:hypothetical protein